MNVTPQIAIDLLSEECKDIEIKLSTLDIENKYKPLSDVQLKEYEHLKNKLAIKNWTCAMTDSRCWLTMQILEKETIDAKLDNNKLYGKAETIKRMIRQGYIKTAVYPALTTSYKFYITPVTDIGGNHHTNEIHNKVIDNYDLFVKYVLDFDALYKPKD